MQIVMGAAISSFLHMQWGYTQPLLMMSIMQPMTVFENKAIAVHVRGKGGPEYERPWKAETAGNPLAQWAEKQKEAAEKQAEEDKKRD